MSSVSFLVLFTTAISKGNFGGLPRKYCVMFRFFPFFPLCLSHHIYRCFIKLTKKKHPLWNNSNTNIIAWDKVKGTSTGPIQERKKYPRLLEEKDGSPEVTISTQQLHAVLNLVIYTNYFQFFFLLDTKSFHSKCKWNQVKPSRQFWEGVRELGKEVDSTKSTLSFQAASEGALWRMVWKPP